MRQSGRRIVAKEISKLIIQGSGDFMCGNGSSSLPAHVVHWVIHESSESQYRYRRI
jgi:hypothetical protein